jgi:hypothetical protein
MEPGKENLLKSRLGKPDERVRDKDREKDTGHPALSVRPYGAKRNVALASWLATVETDGKCLQPNDETAEEHARTAALSVA